MKKNLLLIFVAVIGALLLRCVGNSSVSGTGTLIGNPTIAGVLYNSDGSSAAKVTVHIRPKNYLPDISRLGLAKRTVAAESTVTNNSGQFAFDTTLDTGSYVIEAVKGACAVFIGPIILTTKYLTVQLPPDTLRPTGAIEGFIRLPKGVDTNSVFVLVSGIDRYARVSGNGAFTFDSLAQGTFRMLVVAKNISLADTAGIGVVASKTTGVIVMESTLLPIPPTGKYTVAGYLFNPDGAPAESLNVTIDHYTSLWPDSFPVVFADRSHFRESRTDKTGRYAFDSVPDGMYTLQATNLKVGVFFDSIVVNGNKPVISLPLDTLTPLGAIKGKVRLPDNGDPKMTLIMTYDPYMAIRADSTGYLKLPYLAEGKYRLRIGSFLHGYGVLNKINIPVRPGDTTDIGTIDLPFIGTSTTPQETLFFDPSPVMNPLRIRQTQSSINSFSLAWDAYPQAAGYNFYIVQNDDKTLQFVERVQNPGYIKTNISQRVWYGEYTQLHRYAATYVVKPVVNGKEACDSSRICPSLIDTDAVIYSDYFDAFDGAVLSDKYLFSYYNNRFFPQDAGKNDSHQVYLGNGCLNLDINYTDGMPYMGVMLRNDLNKDIKISFKVNAHRANTYHSYSLNFLAGMSITHNTYTNQFGLYINNVKYSDAEIYDQWTTLSIQLKRKENKIVISYNGENYTIDFDAASIRYNKYLPAGFWGCGWYTGHSAKVDDFRVEYFLNP
jgi:hypothetical protein